MGTVSWPSRRIVPKRERKFALHDASEAQAETRWQCQTCTDVIASDADIYCLSCKSYWQDVSNGMFDHEDDFNCYPGDAPEDSGTE